MLKMGGRELLAVTLAVLMANPPAMLAATVNAASRTAVGSIESHGVVRIGAIVAPSSSTLFAGDRVETTDGNAMVQYRHGSRVTLASESVANFSPARVQLEKGLMTIQAEKNSGLEFAASTLRLQPANTKTAANVTFTNSKASVAVTEGTMKVVDPSGVQLASLNAGEARLFEEITTPATAEPSAASPSPAPPQGGSSSSSGGHKWVIALGAAIVGGSLGIAGLVKANDANSRADSSAAAAASAQTSADAARASATAASAQAAAAAAQAATLQARLNALSSVSANEAALSAALAVQVNRLTQAQAQLSTILSQLAAGTITPAQAQQQVSALQATLNNIISAIGVINTNLQSCASTASNAAPNCPPAP